MVPMYQTLVMPLKNGTQKDLKLGPDFRRDDGTKNNNNEEEVGGLIPRLPKRQKPQPKFIKNLKNLTKLSCKNKIF